MPTSMTAMVKNRCRVLCVGLLVVGTAAASLSARPNGQVPFTASFDTTFQVNSPPPILQLTVQGEGRASHMGSSETLTTNQVVNVITGASTATYTVIAANGDTVVFEDVFTTAPTSNGVTFSGSYTIVGGTGRFAGATGSGSLRGSAQFTGPDSGVGEYSFDGTISAPGSL
jgi:hypothetical protein